LYGAFLWARRARDIPKRRFSVRTECQSCVVEVSVDRLWWWPIHTFRQGVGEEIEFRSRDASKETAGLDEGLLSFFLPHSRWGIPILVGENKW
jgi:hypothetical protein